MSDKITEYVNECSLEKCGSNCDFCGSKSDLKKLAFNWRVYQKGELEYPWLSFFLMFVGILGLVVKNSYTDFKGFHSICYSCRSSLKSRRILSGILYFVFFLAFLINLGVFIFGLFAVTVFASEKPFEGNELNVFLISGASLLIVTVLMIKVKYLGIPAKLKSFKKSPFIFNGTSDF